MSNWRADRAERQVRERLAGGATAAWRQVAVLIDGYPLPVGPSTFLFVDEQGYIVTVNGRVFQKGHATGVTDGPVRRSDVNVSSGPGAGKVIPQITREEGDLLLACLGQAGGERPTEFSSLPGSGRTLSVWGRVRPE